MASKRDVIIGVVIGGFFISGFALFALMFGYLLREDSEWTTTGSGQIAIVEVFGGIYDPSTPVRQLKKWGERDDIKAIVVHINSPGGGVAASHEIYEAINRVRDEEGKIVVASMGSVAASGGGACPFAADGNIRRPV